MLPLGEGRREDERQPHLATAVAVRAEHGAPGEGARLVGEVRLRLAGLEERRVDLVRVRVRVRVRVTVGLGLRLGLGLGLGLGFG